MLPCWCAGYLHLIRYQCISCEMEDSTWKWIHNKISSTWTSSSACAVLPPLESKINTCHILLNYFVFRDIRQVRRSLLDLFPLCSYRYPQTSFKSRPASPLPRLYSVRAGNDVSWKMKFNKYEFRFFPISKRYTTEKRLAEYWWWL